MTGLLRVPRSRGALSGFLLVLLGAWGALIPFIGPYFHYAYSPDRAWAYTSGRLWLEIVPGVATLLGGLILLISSLRPTAMMGAGLAAAAGAWFALSAVLHPLWPGVGSLSAGVPVGSTAALRVAEQIGFFTGLGLVIVFVAAFALGRLAIIGTRDVMLAERPAAAAAPPEPITEPSTAHEEDGEAATQTARHRTLAGFRNRR